MSLEQETLNIMVVKINGFTYIIIAVLTLVHVHSTCRHREYKYSSIASRT